MSDVLYILHSYSPVLMVLYFIPCFLVYIFLEAGGARVYCSEMSY